MKEETENKPKHGRQAETQQRYFSQTKENKYNDRIKINKLRTKSKVSAEQQ